MAAHRCLLGYGDLGQHSLRLRQKSCEKCERNFKVLKKIHDPQVKGRLGLNSYPEVCATSAEPAPPAVVPIQPETLDAATQRRQGLEKVLKELKVPEHEVSSDHKAWILQIVDSKLAAFALHDDDLSVTDRVEHTIDTDDKPPFEERGRPVPFGARD